jgi:N-acetylglutamate synthase-like GNAT family acetyltransferase
MNDLFSYRIAHAKGADLKGLQVEITPANRKALAFYSRRGFRPIPNRHLFRSLNQGKARRQRTRGLGVRGA